MPSKYHLGALNMPKGRTSRRMFVSTGTRTPAIFLVSSSTSHISEYDWTRTESIKDLMHEGDEVQVKLLEIDEKTGKLRLSRKALLPRPEGMPETESKPRGDRKPHRDNGGRRPNRDNKSRNN